MSSDILKLKLQKALLLKELQIANTKIGELKIIAEKKQQKDATMKTTVENKTMSHTVDHFRMPVRSSKVVLKPIETKDVKDREPSVINTKLLKLRQDHIKQEIKRQEAEKIMKEKEITAMKIIKKERDKYRAPPIIPSLLPLRYARSELPCTLEHGFSGQYLSWACPLHNLDYEYYLPFFFDGLQCKEYPVYYLARQGIEDLLFAAKDHPDWILPCLPHLIVPMRNAFFKSDPFLTLGALKALQQLLSCHVEIGPALVPYAKQLLVPMKPCFGFDKNIGDRIDYSQRKNDDIGGQVLKTLEIMEERCGPEVLKIIKVLIPLYESCLKKIKKS